MDLEFEKLIGLKIKQHEWFKYCRGSSSTFYYRYYQIKYSHVWNDAYEITLGN